MLHDLKSYNFSIIIAIILGVSIIKSVKCRQNYL